MLRVPLTQHFVCWIHCVRDCLLNFSWPINDIMLDTAVPGSARAKQRKKCRETSNTLLASEPGWESPWKCLGEFSLTALSWSKSRIKASNLVSPEDSNDLKITPSDQGGNNCFEEEGTNHLIFTLLGQIIPWKTRTYHTKAHCPWKWGVPGSSCPDFRCVWAGEVKLTL